MLMLFWKKNIKKKIELLHSSKPCHYCSSCRFVVSQSKDKQTKKTVKSSYLEFRKTRFETKERKQISKWPQNMIIMDYYLLTTGISYVLFRMNHQFSQQKCCGVIKLTKKPFLVLFNSSCWKHDDASQHVVVTSWSLLEIKSSWEKKNDFVVGHDEQQVVLPKPLSVLKNVLHETSYMWVKKVNRVFKNI